jgi:hypothetical protein
MILSYIKHKTCIILAVSPANADLANSDALQMARIADPDGKIILQSLKYLYVNGSLVICGILQKVCHVDWLLDFYTN